MVTEYNTLRNFYQRFTQYTKVLSSMCDKDKLKEFAEIRKMPLKAVQEAGIFYVDNMAKMIIPDYIEQLNDFGVISENNNKPIFNERWVIPIKESRGMVQNLVGYTPYADERYIYGTAKFYDRLDTLWGLENIGIAYSAGYAIVLEGITDAMRVRSLGYPMAFATCGTGKRVNSFKILNRCRYGIIEIPDRDKAGDSNRKNWTPNRSVLINTPLNYKDSDETVRESEDGAEWLKQYIDMGIDWLLQREHLGLKCGRIEATMI